MAAAPQDEKEREDKKRLMEEILSQYGLAMEECDKKISKSHLQTISECYCERWRYLPCHLDMPDISVKDIERDKEKENERRHLFFCRWEEKKGSDATYKKLMYSLLLIDCRDDAEKICKMICSMAPVPSSPRPSADATNSTAETDPEVPTLDELSPAIYDDLKQQLETSYERIVEQYASYVSHIRQCLENEGIGVDELRTHLINLPAFKHNHDSKELKLLSGRAVDFEKAKNNNELFRILSLECCSFLDFNIFQSLVKKYRLDKGEEEFKYPDLVKKYINDHNIEEFKSINPNLSKKSSSNSEVLELKLDVITLKAKLSEVLNLKIAIAKILGVKSSTLRLVDIKEGCVVLTFSVPANVAAVISYDIFTQKEKEFEDLAVLWLKFKGRRFEFYTKEMDGGSKDDDLIKGDDQINRDDPIKRDKEDGRNKGNDQISRDKEDGLISKAKKDDLITGDGDSQVIVIDEEGGQVSRGRSPSRSSDKPDKRDAAKPVSSKAIGKPFSQTIPPLSVTIRQILQRFPDGQIFKEMIQNADDAGATVIQFYVDYREHGTKNLVDSKLAAYQGPALISANDAMFSDQDWKGIRSLQQSVKAEDPFKVGRFGIGFNSVYHLTDLPMIISGSQVAFFDPQGAVWERGGQFYELQQLSNFDHLLPLHNIAEFKQSLDYYPRTLFRFPLRRVQSNLSDKIYTEKKVDELIEALRYEAELLLLFLRSIHTIEVFSIDEDGKSNLSFRTNIGNEFAQEFTKKRSDFLKELNSYYESESYAFSRVISFTCKLDTFVYDANKQRSSTSQWMVANRIDSTNADVREASVKLKVFPWVGAAVNLKKPCKGRIFCFLPIPVETAPNLPVHINGTFSLNDDRRSLIWTEVERKNDPMADWNDMLLKDVIPACYVDLLLNARPNLFDKLYSAWPDANCLRDTQWEAILKPLFRALWDEEVILSSSGWVIPDHAIYLPLTNKPSPVVSTALNFCGKKLADIPDNVWNAFLYTEKPIIEVSPTYLLKAIRQCPASYVSFSSSEKIELLKYCLSYEKNLSTELINLQLLPLENGDFIAFEIYSSSSVVYLCTDECPRHLVPNLDHKLVKQSIDGDLYAKLMAVAQGETTQLRVLSISIVPTLLDEAMPDLWRNADFVSLPHMQFDSKWFSFFWSWVENKSLSSFENQLILPVCQSDSENVIRLPPSRPVLYIPSHMECSDTMWSVLNKFGILYCAQTYVKHKDLNSYVKTYSSSALLESLALKKNCSSIKLSREEASYLRKQLSKIETLSQKDVGVLHNLQIFLTCENTSGALTSISDCKQSLLRSVVIQPSISFDISVLPPNLMVFSSQDYYQTKLLKNLGFAKAENANFFIEHIFSNLHKMNENFVDNIMTRVLDKYQSLSDSSTEITDAISKLQFVSVGKGIRKCPQDLYDPNNTLLSEMFFGENVFPAAPYNSTKYVNVLKLCGLHRSVSPQEIVDVIYAISLPAKPSPQEVDKVKLCRAKAILNYFASNDFPEQYKVELKNQGHVNLRESMTMLSQSRCWLPVLADRPSNYPSCLPWKGEGYSSHFVSLSDSACVHNPSSLPLVYGSQIYFTHACSLVKTGNSIQSLIPHFKVVIAYKDQLTRNEIITIVCDIYSQLLLHKENKLIQSQLARMEEWIYIKKHHKFVSATNVALQPNSIFSHLHTEPYLYTLPDNISAYSELFSKYGMKDIITRSQIVSILGLIKDEIANDSASTRPEKAWSTVMAILNWLTNSGGETYIGCDAIYVPAESNSEWPDLREPSGLVYTDMEYLKSHSALLEDNSSYTFVNSRINSNLAKCLNVVPLSKKMGISEDAFENAGQYEPLSVRLSNILRDYKDGLSIIKELIQNADDAEATEVNICFDARSHSSDRKTLYFPDMCEAHGPALVIHNNSTFSDEDFKNIQKLAAGTKEEQHLKIGKFGIGFCSVYHITDVPSFVSRDRLYIFDPTLQYLKNVVKDLSRPGMKVTYQNQIITSSRQMEPYEGLFGFRRDSEYQGTMFRLPFRMSCSELSSTIYSESTVENLFDSIQKCGDQLLLFLEHVKRITIQRFDSGKDSPELIHVLEKVSSPKSFSSTHALFTSIQSDDVTKQWLVASDVTTIGANPAVVSVACLLNQFDNSYSVCDTLSGEVFCYLPLSQTSGLPVHVSCNFAVTSDRKGIWTSDETSSASCHEAEWNLKLMKEVIPKTYFKLMSILKTMSVEGQLQEYNFFSLWPLSLKLKNPWNHLVATFYSMLRDDSDKQLFYSNSMSKWLTFADSIFLAENMFCYSGTPTCIIEILCQLKIPIVDLPSSHQILNFSNTIITEIKFTEIFFESLQKFCDVHSSRNEIIYHMLQVYASSSENKQELCFLLEEKLGSCACIPTAPDGTLMRKCSEIVDPNALLSKLFDMADQRFPIERLRDHFTLTALKQLGMIHSSLPDKLILEQSQSIKVLMETNKLKALQRASLILHTLSMRGINDSEFNIDSIPFLPVLCKPEEYPLHWYGEKYSDSLLSGKELMHFSPTNLFLAGSQVVFVCEDTPEKGGCDKIYNTQTQLLKIRTSPRLTEVINHLQVLVSETNSGSPPSCEWVSQACSAIYDFIDKLCRKEDSELDLSQLKTFPCIWNGTTFLEVDSLAMNWKMKDGPHLYATPPEVAAKKALVKSLGIKGDFDFDDAVQALQSMKSDFGESKISEACMDLINEISLIFNKVSAETFKSLEKMLYLPDSNNILHSSTDLVYNDVSWAPLDESCILVNSVFSREVAIKLGVRLETSKLLDQYSSKKSYFCGVSFGQREELIRRIQNIIQDYPFGITILKELLQNADDAKAKKMYIILDKRTHGKQSVISQDWQELQGPALLVWNDSKFTESDLKGIQELGLGSKRSDTESIGQFGIGFNVVYHLTDCPSFITGGETLCVFDPHCRYVPEAKETLPGGRYDNLSGGFWKEFKDMSSAYLQTGTDNLPEELRGGSLFRFPIRHTSKMVQTSKIICREEELMPEFPTSEVTPSSSSISDQLSDFKAFKG